MFYRLEQGTQAEYQPDFVAETDDEIYMLEVKQQSQLDDPVVLAKRDAAVEWCRHAADYTQQHGGKPWRYGLIGHSAIAQNITLENLTKTDMLGDSSTLRF